MEIIKQGTVLFDGNDFVFAGWHVEGGTIDEFHKYAVKHSKLSYLAIMMGYF